MFWNRKALLALLFLAPADAGAVPSFTTTETGTRLSSAAIQSAVYLGSSNTYPIRAYYTRLSTGGFIYSATSSDGLTFTDDIGVRVSSLTVPNVDVLFSTITGCSALPLTGGGYRMLYSVIGATGSYRIYSATSADGLGWANESGVRIMVGSSGTNFVGSPSMVKLNSGNWALYFIENTVAGNQFQNHQIFSSFSSDQGQTWSAPSVAVSTQAGQVAAIARTDGIIRLHYTLPLSGSTVYSTITSALATNVLGTSFLTESNVRFSTTAPLGWLSNPFVFRSTDSFRWRLYSDFIPFQPPGLSTGDVFSAVTDVPDVQSISPSSVYYTQGATAFAISGEVISTSPASVVLSMAGQPNITGTSIVWSNDQTITATFNPNNQAQGLWTLTVTDSNGQSGSLSGAVLITFPPGGVYLTNNLLRPRQGTPASINVQIFNPGRVTAKIYTTLGEPVNTVFDGNMAVGSSTVTWNATTSLGRTVASGLYLLHVTGPKLDMTGKIIVIK